MALGGWTLGHRKFVNACQSTRTKVSSMTTRPLRSCDHARRTLSTPLARVLMVALEAPLVPSELATVGELTQRLAGRPAIATQTRHQIQLVTVGSPPHLSPWQPATRTRSGTSSSMSRSSSTCRAPRRQRDGRAHEEIGSVPHGTRRRLKGG